MGREVKRVSLDFDWPVGRTWLPYLGGVCSSDVDSCVGKDKAKAMSLEETCEICRHAARLAGIEISNCECPKWRVDPPAGGGWQMWETTSDGSPISPVFATPEELARWLADTGASSFGRMTEGYETWLKMIVGGGSAMSMCIDSTGMKSGVKAAADMEK